MVASGLYATASGGGGADVAAVASVFNRIGWTAGGGLGYAAHPQLVDQGRVSQCRFRHGERWDLESMRAILERSRSTATNSQKASPAPGVNYKFDWAGPVVAKF